MNNVEKYNLPYAVPNWLSSLATTLIQTVLYSKREQGQLQDFDSYMTVNIVNPFFVEWQKDRHVNTNRAQIYLYSPGNYVTVGFQYHYDVYEGKKQVAQKSSPIYFVTSHDSCWTEGLKMILNEMYSVNPSLLLTGAINFRINTDPDLVHQVTDREANLYPSGQFKNDAQALHDALNPKGV